MKNRRGLRILLWIPCFFILAQVLGGLILDYVWVQPRYPAKASMFAQFKARDPRPEIVFLGSSRFMGSVNSDYMDAVLRVELGERAPRSFNASLGGGDPTVFDHLLNDFLDDGYRPRLVVVEVDSATLAGRDNWLYAHALNVLDWRDVPEAIPALCKNGRIMYLLRGRLLPLYLHNYHIRKGAALLAKSLVAPEQRPVSRSPGPLAVPDLVTPPPVTPEVRTLMEAGQRNMVKMMENYRLDGVVTRRLERLLARCHSNGIGVLLVGVPTSSYGRQACTPEVHAAYTQYIQDLCSRFGCTYTDWRAGMPDEYFWDVYHANEAGSIYFSRRFAAEELAPWWRNNTHVRSTALQTGP